MHFEYDMSGCPATCTNPTADDPAVCVEPREIGCACDEGYVLSGDKCVPMSECGCFKDGMYFKVCILYVLFVYPRNTVECTLFDSR